MVWSLASGSFCIPHWSSKQIEAASSHSWFKLIPSVARSYTSNVKLAQMGLKWSELAHDQFKPFLTRKNQFWPVLIYFDQFNIILQSWSLRSVNSGRRLKTMLIWAKARNQVLTKVETGLKTRKENRWNERVKCRSQSWLREAQKRLVAPKPIFFFFERWEAILRR